MVFISNLLMRLFRAAIQVIVRGYISSLRIETIGRSGEWDYLCTFQCVMSEMNI